MSSVLHPVGPEPRERYWVRRVAVLVAAVVAIGIVIALVGNAMSAGSAVQAEPAPPTIVPAPTTASPTPGATPGSVSPSASATPSGTPTAAPTSTTTSTPATPTPKPSSSSTATSTDKGATSKSTSPKKSTKKSTTPTKQPVYAACDTSDLRAALTGDDRVEVKKKTTFTVSLVNRGKKTCTATVKPSSATLTIVSGSDRIWSTKDCPAAQPTTKRTLLPGHALAWKVTWSGKRSGDGCSTGKVAPKKGYYWAIANVDGVGDTRFRVILG